MAIIATPARRRIIMIVLLSLAAGGGVVRSFAAPGSTLHDVGTMLLVLWLPAVGNLIAWLVRRMPRRAPRTAGFPAGSAFTPHLRAHLEPIALPEAQRVLHAAAGPGCLLLVGQQAFTARLAQPVAQALATAQAQPIELLRPAAAREQLAAGTSFHVLVGTTAVAKGQVEN